VLSQNGLTNDHPTKAEVLRKIFSSTTVRQPVRRLVYGRLLRGEGRDDAAVQARAELGSGIANDPSDDRCFRSKFFAIVDRTYLAIDPNNQLKQATRPPLVVAATTALRPTAGTVTLPIAATGSTADGRWDLQVGNNVVLGVGTTNQTWATVSSLTPLTVTTNPALSTTSSAVRHRAAAHPPTAPGIPSTTRRRLYLATLTAAGVPVQLTALPGHGRWWFTVLDQSAFRSVKRWVEGEAPAEPAHRLGRSLALPDCYTNFESGSREQSSDPVWIVGASCLPTIQNPYWV
jgi:hypothetical protein